MSVILKVERRRVGQDETGSVWIIKISTNEDTSLFLLLVRRGDPVRVLRSRLGMTKNGLAWVTVVRFIQGDVLDDKRRQGAAVSRNSSATTCRDTNTGLDTVYRIR